MTRELFNSIINTSQDCVFWKDKNRRFVGVNQAFLDFYGFESADVLIGKTDEDMGWHTDPEPFKQDELDVLNGKSTYKVQGKCIIRGDNRDIIASKRPLYDGDKIIGLVGSFVDITDVLRRSEEDNRQIVYTIEKLRKYAFFDKIVDDISLDEIVDPLTGVLSRQYAVRFIHSLVEENIPFTFSMIDLDNFKYFNDTFGHSAGDKVLMTVSKRLADYTDGYGLVGRFGGDELLLIDMFNCKMKDKRSFFERIYSKSSVLRSSIEFENGSSYITATTGAASFPEDADNFDDLFGLIDKMLYLGKSTGRNCYSIYNKKEHKNIEITKLANHGIYSSMTGLRNALDKKDSFNKKIKAALPLISEILQVEDLFFVNEKGRMKSVGDTSFKKSVKDIEKIMDEDIFPASTLDDVEKKSPDLYSVLKENGFESVLIARIRNGGDIQGHLVCAAKRSHRIWQENECATLYYLAGLLAE